MSHASRRRAPALIPTLLPPEGGEELNHGGGNVFPLCFQSREGPTQWEGEGVRL